MVSLLVAADIDYEHVRTALYTLGSTPLTPSP